VRLVIRHQTRLAFATPVREHHCELRVAPADDGRQARRALRIAVEPAARLRPYSDAFGNLVHAFDVLSPHRELVTLVEAEVETSDADPLEFVPVPPERELAWIAEALRAHPPLWDFVVHRSAATPAVEQVPTGIPTPYRDDDDPVLDCVRGAMAWVGRALVHVTEAQSADATPLAQAIEAGAGTSQDFAHLLVSVVRSWGVPARIVAGYLDPGDGGLDERATHTWAEVLVPGGGWIGFDAVHERVADARYVRVATGRDHADTAPRRGTFLGAERGNVVEVRSAIMRQYQQ
jgi:transglutaminase-like putative cysteine protease